MLLPFINRKKIKLNLPCYDMNIAIFRLRFYYSIESLQQVIEEYIEFYNTQRLQAKLKGLTPIE